MENSNGIKTKVVNGLMWKLLERSGVQGVQFVISIILARLLLPEEYGLIALITVFIAIANVFVQSGFGAALIQKKDSDMIDFNSVFFFNLVVAIILYFILFAIAPLVAGFYDDPLLKPVLRVQSLLLILGALNTVQNSLVQKRMEFKKLFKVSIGAVIVQGITGIVMAYNGMGVWSLVFSGLAGSVTTTIILWYVTKWKPSFNISLLRLKELFMYGYGLLLSSLIDTVYNNAYSLIIGKIYNQETLAFYNKGQNMPNLLVTNINSSIDGVLFPALSVYQDDKVRLKQLVRRSIVTSCYLIFPMMAGLIAVSKPLTIILLTDKWLPSVPFMQLACIMFAMWPIHTANLQAIKAIGRSDVFLKLEIIKKIMGISIMVITIPFGVFTMMVGCVINSLIATFINSYPNKKLLGYRFVEQIKDIMPSLLLSIIMCCSSYSIILLGLSNFITLIIQMLIGIMIYLLGSYIFKMECFFYLLNTFKELINKRGDKNEK